MAKWNIKTYKPQLISNLMSEFSIPEIYAKVLANRGIYSLEESRDFFSPDIANLYDPFLMLDMEKAADYIVSLIQSGEKIFVFGDYDVDGTTGASMLFLFLKSVGANVEAYVPDREKEGYGLSQSSVDQANDMGVKLIITCDCGINARIPVEYANKLGIRVVITDHHTPDETLPPAFAILNPKQKKCKYPFKRLCGGGVTFKLASAVAVLLKVDPSLVLNHLDLITLGTAADIVPIIDENRIIVHHGLRQLAVSDKPGIRALLDGCNLSDKELTVGRLVFWVAPRINAAGRIGDANRAVKLLTTNSFTEAVQLFKQLDQENKYRQEIQKNIVDEAILQVNNEVNLDKENAIVLCNEGWHRGIIGIVASKIKEEYNRPVVIISTDGDIGKGSARSIHGFDLYENLSLCSDYIDEFGGHPMAAGLTISTGNLAIFRQKFVELANEKLSEDDLLDSINVEGEMELSTIDKRFMNFLDKLSPFGPGNMRPQFISRQITTSGYPRLLGFGKDHLGFVAKQGNVSYSAIGFNLAKHYERLIRNTPVDIAYVVEINEWNGQRKIQLNVRDIQPSSKSR